MLALLVIAGLISGLPDGSSRSERIQVERIERFRAHAVGWEAFCVEVACEEIPQGFVAKSIGEQTYMLPRFGNPDVAGCQLATDRSDKTQYIDRVFQRGASLDRNGFSYYVWCEEKLSRAQFWEEYVLIYGGHFWQEQPGFNSVHRDQLGSPWERPTYESRLSILRPFTPDFWQFEAEDTAHSRVYLSTEPMFQGRHVALFCQERCEMTSISFADDPHLTTIYVNEVLQFPSRKPACDVYQSLWTCGLPMEERLAFVARYIQFLDSALDQSRSSPLNVRREN